MLLGRGIETIHGREGRSEELVVIFPIEVCVSPTDSLLEVGISIKGVTP